MTNLLLFLILLCICPPLRVVCGVLIVLLLCLILFSAAFPPGPPV